MLVLPPPTTDNSTINPKGRASINQARHTHQVNTKHTVRPRSTTAVAGTPRRRALLELLMEQAVRTETPPGATGIRTVVMAMAMTNPKLRFPFEVDMATDQRVTEANKVRPTTITSSRRATSNLRHMEVSTTQIQRRSLLRMVKTLTAVAQIPTVVDMGSTHKPKVGTTHEQGSNIALIAGTVQPPLHLEMLWRQQLVEMPLLREPTEETVRIALQHTQVQLLAPHCQRPQVVAKGRTPWDTCCIGTGRQTQRCTVAKTVMVVVTLRAPIRQVNSKLESRSWNQLSRARTKV